MNNEYLCKEESCYQEFLIEIGDTGTKEIIELGKAVSCRNLKLYQCPNCKTIKII